MQLVPKEQFYAPAAWGKRLPAPRRPLQRGRGYRLERPSNIAGDEVSE